MLYAIDDEGYLEITQFAKELYQKFVLNNTYNDEDRRIIVQELYEKYEDHYLSNYEKRLFKLNLLINDNYNALHTLTGIYYKYLPCDEYGNMKDTKNLKDYGFTDCCNLIIEEFMFRCSNFGISKDESEDKINELIKFGKIIETVQKGNYKQVDNTQETAKQSKKSNVIDLMKIVSPFEELDVELKGRRR